MRDSITLPATIPAVGIAPLSRRAQRKIMSFAGLDSVDQEHALDQLRQSAGEVAGRPLAFNLWCATVTSTVRDATQIAAPDNLYDVLAGTVGVRLGESSVPTPADAASLRFLADDIAYCMLTEPGLASTPSRRRLVAVLQQRAEHPPHRTEDALRQLEELGLAVARRPHTFAFTHRSFQDFFASSWLMRNAGVVDLDHVLTDRRWRDPAIMAMQAGSDDFRITVLDRAAGLLADLARPLISDLSSFLDTAPDDALPVVLDRSTTVPNLKLTHILTVVAAVPSTSLALVPDVIREVADRVAVTAFAQGDRTDQRDILTLLRLMSPQVAKWSAERAVYRGGLLLETTALTLFRAQRPIHDLSPSSRLGLIAGLAGMPVISRQILHASNSGTALGTLTALVRDLILALRVGAGLMFAVWLYIGVQGATDAPEVVILSGLICTACVALIGLTFIKAERQTRWPELTAGSVVMFSVLLLFLGAILDLLSSLIQVATGHESVFYQLVTTYAMTWPACMLAMLLFGPAPSRQDWFFPQWSLVKVLHSLRTVIPPIGWRRLLTLIVRVALGFLALGYVAAGPVPFMSGETETRTRQAVAAVALAIGIIAVSAHWLSRQLRGRRGLRRNIAEGTLTNEILLGHLKETGGGQWRMQLLLKSLRQAPPDTLRDSMDVLADLTRALAQVDRMVPADTTTRIPRGVWDVGPRYAHADFRHWLEDFDAAHPGRLTWLATNYSDALARLVTRIEPTVAPLPRRRPPRDPRAHTVAAP